MRIWGTWPALLLALAVACNGDSPAPSATPSPVASSPSVSPSPSASLDPAAQAVAAVRAYYAETTAAYATGRVDRLREMSTPACPCRAVVTSVQQSWANGSLRGGVYTIRDVRLGTVSDRTVLATVTYDLTALQELDRSGRVTRSSEALTGASAEVELVRNADRWLVNRITRLGSQS